MANRGSWGGLTDSRVFRVNVSWIAALQKCMTGFHLRDIGPAGQTPEDVIEPVKDWAQSDFRGILHASDKLVGIDVVNLETKEGASFSFTNVNGISNSTPVATFMQCPVSIKSGYRMRQANGRMLWPVRDASQVTGNELSSIGQTAFNTAAQGLISRFTGAGIVQDLQLCHVHDDIKDAGGVIKHPKQWYDADSLRVNTLLSFIKRRKVGVGS